jgi:hypothetical protein
VFCGGPQGARSPDLAPPWGCDVLLGNRWCRSCLAQPPATGLDPFGIYLEQCHYPPIADAKSSSRKTSLSWVARGRCLLVQEKHHRRLSPLRSDSSAALRQDDPLFIPSLSVLKNVREAETTSEILLGDQLAVPREIAEAGVESQAEGDA